LLSGAVLLSACGTFENGFFREPATGAWLLCLAAKCLTIR
jgi:hypothetical protein